LRLSACKGKLWLIVDSKNTSKADKEINAHIRFVTEKGNGIHGNGALGTMKLGGQEYLDRITIKSDRFDFEPEITAKVLRLGYHIYEVPISYSGRDFDEGKKITWTDGFSALGTLVRYRFWKGD